jgi:hypothetical protein
MPDAIEYLLWRHTLDDGAQTTLYAVRHPIGSTRVRVVHFADSHRLDVWCAANGATEAIVGGFFVREPYRPLGEVWIDGRASEHEPVAAPYGQRRACVAGDGAGVRFGPRGTLAGATSGRPAAGRPAAARRRRGGLRSRQRPRGLLGRGGAVRLRHHRRPVSAGRARVSRDALIAVACDGRRSGVDAGLSMLELARVFIGLGADHAINLDGGGSTTLVHRGHLLNRPYPSQNQPAPETRSVVTALVFERA